MKELFKETYLNFKKNSQIWILTIVIYCLIMTIGLSISYVVGLMDILVVILVMCPFISTFIKLAIKSIEDEPVDTKDVYAGYKELTISIVLFFKRLIKVILLCLLFYFVAYMVLAFIDVLFFEEELMNNMLELIQNGGSQTELINILMKNEGYINRILISNYIALGLTFIIFNFVANKKILTIIFQRIFVTNKVNYDYIVNNKKELKKYNLTIYNLFISLFYVVGLVVAILVNMLLTNLTGNTFIAYLVSVLIFFVISSIAIPFKYIGYTHIFEYNFNDDVMKLMNELGKPS